MLIEKLPEGIFGHFQETENLRLHYLSAGDGEPIFFLHGWPTSSFLWRNLMSPLSEKYKVVALDLPGFGKSDKKLYHSYSFPYYSKAIDDFLYFQGLKKVTLAVHDLGGPLGLWWMINNIHKVERLILFNTLVYPNFSFALMLFGLATRIPMLKKWLVSQKGIKKAMLVGVNQEHKMTTEIIRQYQSIFENPASQKVLLKTVKRLSKKGFKDIARELNTFEGPVKIIYGTKDKILPDVARTMRRVKKDLPQAEISILDNCGHFLQEEEPEHISRLVDQFMTNNPIERIR